MTNTDPIKALVDLGPELERLMSAATATPWGNRGKLSDRIVGTDEKTIAEFVSQALGKTGDEQDEANAIFCTFIVNNTQTILAAIEALKPLADGTHVVVGSVFLNDLRAIADTGGRRIETAMDACDKIIELIDMERRLGPVSTAPVDEGRVERIVKAFEGVLLDINFAIEQGILPDIMNDMIYVEARAALAAIKGVE